MRRPDGREVLVRLAYPLPLNLAPELLAGIAQGARAAGYIDVCLDANDQGAIVATPPGPSRCHCTKYDRDTAGGCSCGHQYDQHAAGANSCHGVVTTGSYPPGCSDV